MQKLHIFYKDSEYSFIIDVSNFIVVVDKLKKKSLFSSYCITIFPYQYTLNVLLSEYLFIICAYICLYIGNQVISSFNSYSFENHPFLPHFSK